jgi:aspartate racemase
MIQPNARKILGVIGGMGPQATCLFYQQIIDRTAAASDQDHIPMIILNHSTIPDRTQAILSGTGDVVYSLLLEDAKSLEQNGASAIAIPCNTSHYFADRIQNEIGVPLIHMVRETVHAMAARGRKRVGILATDGTIQTGLYQAECARLGLEAVVPSSEIQKIVMHIIYNEIKRGLPGSRSLFAKIDQELRQRGCDGAILACTELSCFAADHDLLDYYTDAMGILVERCILACGGHLKSPGQNG